MKFTSPSMILPLFVGLSAALVARATQKDVYSDYEHVVAPGIPGVSNAVPLPAYNQLHYDDFIAVHAKQQQPEYQLLTYPNGTGAAIGRNGSSLTSLYIGSPVASFKLISAKFGCFLSDETAVAPGVFCIVQVTAYRLDGSEYPTKADCQYSGIGVVQLCTFPSTWAQVGKLSFTVITSALLATVGNTIPGLLGSLSPPGLATIGYYMDDFDSFYTCVTGKSIDPASGLCV
ncbi:hypothetical protein ACMFMG_007238 [Clarireedia jacksonii]